MENSLRLGFLLSLAWLSCSPPPSPIAPASLSSARLAASAPAHASSPVPASRPIPSASTVVPVAEVPPVDGITTDTALFLAGMRGDSHGRLDELRGSPLWRTYARDMDERWQRAEGSRLEKVRAFSRKELRKEERETAVLLYPFGGPDFLFAHAFFPGARRYVLCGLEEVGSIPDPQTLGVRLAASLHGLRESLATSLDVGYFITENLQEQLGDHALKGVVPILLFFLARTHHDVHRVELVSIQSNGALVPHEPTQKKSPDGVRILFADSCPHPPMSHDLGEVSLQELLYVRTDLSDEGVERDGRFMKLVERESSAVTFLKSASYFLHKSGFSRTRSAILASSTAILQDPSGLPFRKLASEPWKVLLYGAYATPIRLFKDFEQPDLRRAYADKALPLDFGIGYKHVPSQSSLILARRAH